jgi:predicted membrane protein (TIGR00267 family)
MDYISLNKRERDDLKRFVKSELFDLTLYEELLKIEKRDYLKNLLSQLIEIEKKHLQFWQKLTETSRSVLPLSLKIKLGLFLLLRKILGPLATILILETIEIYGIKKYFHLYEKYKNTSLGEKIREILIDEFEHEDKIVTEKIQKNINIDKIKSIVLGFNDGFVEIFGALGGLLATFENKFLVGVTGLIIGLAGSLSMGSSAYLSAKSERDFETIEKRKKKILSGNDYENYETSKENPLSLGLYVGISYFLAVFFPVLPFLLGAKNIIFSIIIGLFLVSFLSFFTASFASETFLEKLKSNLIILTSVIIISYLIGNIMKISLGITI